ncbi:G protein-activated inward rectifier potassium channel 3-like [Conger conger]|uniref:G protein-activated inward rectifier potassium channel 3-like n=1 Tax=Conger conger TaxID=82655 RepID=UPI002A5AA7FF|nr:G protein-activated inward rectifier potassium channel 3-like [Conger conger]
MISTEIRSSVASQEVQGWRRPHLRRNSVPPVRTLRAKHLLAYLPRPSQRSPHTLTEKVRSPHTLTEKVRSPHTLTEKVRSPHTLTEKVRSPHTLTEKVRSPHTLTEKVRSPHTLTEKEREQPGEVSCRECRDPGKPQRSPLCHKRLSSRWRVRGASRVQRGPAGEAAIFSSPAASCRGRPRGERYVEALVGDGRRRFSPEGEQRQRYVTKDGKCHVNLGGIDGRARFLSDVFTTLVDLRCRWFLLAFTVCYIATWLAFAQAYFLDAWLRGDLWHATEPEWRPCYRNVDSFLSALLLLVESQMTIGYGSRTVTPECAEGVALLMAQCIVGSALDVLMMGCVFVKISRPQKRAQTLVFSERCVVSARDGRLCLMFRVGDLRESHMVEAKIRARLVRSRLTAEGEFLPLEQAEISLGLDTGADRLFLVEPQTVSHVIDPASPLWETSAQTLKRDRLEVVVILEGIVEASGMTCQARTSYTEDEILWGHRFESCMTKEKGAFQVDYSTFDKTYPVKTCCYSAKEMQERPDLSSYWSTVSDIHQSQPREHLWAEHRAGVGSYIHSSERNICDVYAKV